MFRNASANSPGGHISQKALLFSAVMFACVCDVDVSEVHGIRWNPLFFDGPSASRDPELPLHVPPVHGFPVPVWPSITLITSRSHLSPSVRQSWATSGPSPASASAERFRTRLSLPACPPSARSRPSEDPWRRIPAASPVHSPLQSDADISLSFRATEGDFWI